VLIQQHDKLPFEAAEVGFEYFLFHVNVGWSGVLTGVVAETVIDKLFSYDRSKFLFQFNHQSVHRPVNLLVSQRFRFVQQPQSAA